MQAAMFKITTFQDRHMHLAITPRPGCTTYMSRNSSSPLARRRILPYAIPVGV